MSKLKLLKPAIEVFHFPKFTKASEVLKAAKRVIQDERRWTQNSLAMKQEVYKGDQVVGELAGVDWVSCAARVPKSGKTEAAAFCALGAVMFVNGPAEKEAVKFLSTAAAIELEKAKLDEQGKLVQTESDDESGKMLLYKPRKDDIFELNDDDEEAHPRVMGMFKLAIQLAKKAEKLEAKKNGE